MMQHFLRNLILREQTLHKQMLSSLRCLLTQYTITLHHYPHACAYEPVFGSQSILRQKPKNQPALSRWNLWPPSQLPPGGDEPICLMYREKQPRRRLDTPTTGRTGSVNTMDQLVSNLETDSSLRLKAMAENVVSKEETEVKLENGSDLFIDMRSRFLSFKRDTYLRNLEHFENLAKSQTPKFMVIACADSRVCPSTILGFKPGEAFMLRNVANLVPPFEKGPSETNAALEFAVNSLEVENVLVIGHSCCGGIQALMSMEDEGDSRSFIRSWVSVGKKARANTKAAVPNLHFEQQCQHCEKESVNCSLENLLTYPWIEERVAKGVLSLHGGYYNFVDCTFEKWTLDYRKGSLKEDGPRYHITNQEYWC